LTAPPSRIGVGCSARAIRDDRLVLFNSIEYLLFLPLVTVAYFTLRGHGRRGLLLLASFGFYWYYSVPLSLLLVWSTVLDYTCARVIDGSSGWRRKAALAVSMCGNLGTLAAFKYYGFFNQSLGWLCGAPPLPGLELALPMGISFYTFQTMSYTIDVYRGHCRAQRSMIDLSLYVTFFPQLVAGPIMRGPDLLPQFHEKHEPNLERFLSGALLCSWGLIKKMFVADPIGRIVDAVYGTAAVPAAAGEFSGVALLIATYAFAVQIYCDFSAYSDIAVGSARILGFRLVRNFDAPYLAESIRDFWRRWHITLSQWLRDYLYVPLGGNRGGAFRTCRNLMLTMVLGGLWHGANWTFVVWGALHGAYLVGERLLSRRSGAAQPPWPLRFVQMVVTFHLVCLAWVFFRADSVSQASEIVGRILTLASGREIGFAPVAVLGALLAVQALKRRVDFGEIWLSRPYAARWAVYATLGLLVIALARSQPPQFIYFQF
jgi:D-alanyl-lipoteichoic acid acyltransferase DltB (MBOAT superfamily)